MEAVILQPDRPLWAAQISTFAVRRRPLSLGFYVMARLRDGTTRKLAKFPTRALAEYWIEVECSRWLPHAGRTPKAA